MTKANPQHGREATAILGLGSNLGDREEHLRSGVAALEHLGKLEAVSSFYETVAVGPVRQPDFVNAAVLLRTALPAEELMAALLRIEQQHGRDRTASVPKGPRTLDLDLLSYDALVMHTPRLTLPHPAIADRRFVLVPLIEIAPAWKHPVSGKTATEMLAELARRGDGSGQILRKMKPR